ncbi:hypothetical protein VT47_09865 [Pseudomonas syringae pv. syringae]|uniref:restriction endonuclease n=1 Tax=Pseudomonas syringae TaxID=317 RepID=UPI0007AE3AC7|nr:restriction endonuclease [Pseudomonas syringae]KZL39469.1 hypothetical protein VT47_09865 [Pseudomonas syringae pv. syringae]
MDYSKLSGHEFEMLCARLVKAEGNTLQPQEAKSQDIGVDFAFSDQSGKSWIVEAKHFTRPRMSTIAIRQSAGQLSSAKQLVAANNGLLILSMMLPRELKEEIETRDGISIWDGPNLNRLLIKHPEIEKDFQALLDARANAQRDPSPPAVLEPRAQELIDRLDALAPGQPSFRDFEDLCVEILNYAFFPQLGVPSVQSQSEDRLDIRDAVYPISSDQHFWQEIRKISATRFMVAEFKNYPDPVGQREVESIQQYLYTKAMRTFGVLCSRKPPSSSALLARRRAWVEADKLILLLCDEDLKDLVRARSYGEKPTDVLDAQLGEFFLKLTP